MKKPGLLYSDIITQYVNNLIIWAGYSLAGLVIVFTSNMVI